MRKIYFVLFAALLTASVFAQAPQKMSYQAVIRNSSNQFVTSHTVGMKITILQGFANGTVVYTETITPIPTTNANGLVSIEIGGGTGFDAINWSSGLFFIKTETDPLGGTNYTITGTSQLLSVPYSLYSNNAGNGLTTSDATKLANLSGTNTGDETTVTIKSKLAITTLSGSNTGDQDLSGKVDKVTGKGLSTNDYTTGLKDISNGMLFEKELKSSNNVGIYTMYPDGSNIVFIHASGTISGWYSSTIWSKDKKKILYSSNLSTTSKSEIFLMNSDGTGNTQLTSDNPQYGNAGAIFRSDTKIWYSNCQSTGWSEFTEINFDGSAKLKLTNFNSQGKSVDYGLDINKVNTKLCYYKQSSSNGPTGRIYISNIDFSNEQRLTSNTTWELSPKFSPDGQKIAYIRGTGQTLLNVYVVNLDGSSDTKLTDITASGAYASKPLWSPDSKKIAYSLYDGSQYDIWVMNSDGTGKKNITNTPDYNEILTDWK